MSATSLKPIPIPIFSKYMKPNNVGYSIYTKSGCRFCDKVKNMLQHGENVDFINSDAYLEENKPAFLQFIQTLTGKDWRTFPIVFHNETFIGGYVETQQYNEKLDAFDNI